MDTERLEKKPVRQTAQGWDDLSQESFAEKHYRLNELAKLWGLGRETVRQIVMCEPGVLKVRQGCKKANTTYSVPESVVRRIHMRLTNAA